MARRSENELRVNDRVVASEDLSGIPAGTPGKIILKNGVVEHRYRVFFDVGGPNGTDVGNVSGSVLQRVDRKGNLK